LGWLGEVDYRIMEVKERPRRCRWSVNHHLTTFC